MSRDGSVFSELAGPEHLVGFGLLGGPLRSVERLLVAGVVLTVGLVAVRGLVWRFGRARWWRRSVGTGVRRVAETRSARPDRWSCGPGRDGRARGAGRCRRRPGSAGARGAAAPLSGTGERREQAQRLGRFGDVERPGGRRRCGRPGRIRRRRWIGGRRGRRARRRRRRRRRRRSRRSQWALRRWRRRDRRHHQAGRVRRRERWDARWGCRGRVWAGRRDREGLRDRRRRRWARRRGGGGGRRRPEGLDRGPGRTVGVAPPGGDRRRWGSGWRRGSGRARWCRHAMRTGSPRWRAGRALRPGRDRRRCRGGCDRHGGDRRRDRLGRRALVVVGRRRGQGLGLGSGRGRGGGHGRGGSRPGRGVAVLQQSGLELVDPRRQHLQRFDVQGQHRPDGSNARLDGAVGLDRLQLPPDRPHPLLDQAIEVILYAHLTGR